MKGEYKNLSMLMELTSEQQMILFTFLCSQVTDSSGIVYHSYEEVINGYYSQELELTKKELIGAMGYLLASGHISLYFNRRDSNIYVNPAVYYVAADGDTREVDYTDALRRWSQAWPTRNHPIHLNQAFSDRIRTQLTLLAYAPF